MSNIDELISQLCPNGVAYLPLWKVTVWDKRFNSVDRAKQTKTVKYPHVSASTLKTLEAPGEIKLLSTGKYSGWTTEALAGQNIGSGEVITVPSGGSANLKYWNGKFVDSGNLIGISADSTKYNLKYVYYYLLSKNTFVESCFRGSGVKHPDMGQILEIKMPVPPIMIQNEIVHVLDKFTQLDAELTAELTARKKQYSYYRNKLLTNENWDIVSLGEVCTLITKGTTPKAFSASGVRFIKTESFENNTINNDKTVYVSEQTHRTELKRSILQNHDILFTIAGATIGKCAMVEEINLPANTNQALAIIRLDNEVINHRFVFYYIQSQHMTDYVSNKSKGSAQPNLNLRQLNEFPIPLPSLDEQRRIVKILDGFDAIINDSKGGLLGEKKARRKQYEYYRTKLLTFQELPV